MTRTERAIIMAAKELIDQCEPGCMKTISIYDLRQAVLADIKAKKKEKK